MSNYVTNFVTTLINLIVMLMVQLLDLTFGFKEKGWEMRFYFCGELLGVVIGLFALLFESIRLAL